MAGRGDFTVGPVEMTGTISVPKVREPVIVDHFAADRAAGPRRGRNTRTVRPRMVPPRRARRGL